MLRALRRRLDDSIAAWRTGTRESQGLILASLLIAVVICFAISLANYSLMPLTAYYLWLLIGMMLLRFAPLVVLSIVTVVAALTAMISDGPLVGPRITAIFVLLLSTALILYTSSRQHSGLPQPVSEAMLADLRDRLRSQGTIPELPPDWEFESVFLSAHGGGYSGDFLVAQLTPDGRQLELILVDVAGKGVPAATRALQFGGALGGLIGCAPAAGRGGRRQPLPVPPAVRRDVRDRRARPGRPRLRRLPAHQRRPPARARLVGHRTALGHRRRPGYGAGRGARPGDPHLLGHPRPREALLLYTDGVVETRTADLDRGVTWLQHEAQEAVHGGFGGAARQILGSVESEDDDRAVIIVRRRPVLTRLALRPARGPSSSLLRMPILLPSHTSGSYLRSTTRSFIGMIALSVILMPSGHTSVQHLVMLHIPMPAASCAS